MVGFGAVNYMPPISGLEGVRDRAILLAQILMLAVGKTRLTGMEPSGEMTTLCRVTLDVDSLNRHCMQGLLMYSFILLVNFVILQNM